MSTSYDYSHAYIGQGKYSPVRWSATHDLIHDMVPFAHFNGNPWAQLKQLRDHLQDRPAQSSTWRFRDVPSLTREINHNSRMQVLVDLLGAWPLNHGNTLGRLYVNPFYDDLDRVDWTPDEEKLLFGLRWGLLGKWTIYDVSGPYNHSKGGLQDMLAARGFRWSNVRDYGRRRLANTVALTAAWTDISQVECCRRVGVPEATMIGWVDKHGTLDPVPERPSESGIGASW